MIGDVLTPMERRVAELIAEGRELAEIGEMVGYSYHTVKNMATVIYDKLDLVQPRRRPAILLTRLVMKEQLTDGQ